MFDGQRGERVQTLPGGKRLPRSFAAGGKGPYFLGLDPSEGKGRMLESHRCSMPDLCPDHAAQSRGSPGPVTGAEHMWVPAGSEDTGEFTGIPGGAPCTRSPSSHARPASGPSPWMPPFPAWAQRPEASPGTAGREARGWGCPCSAAAPPWTPAEAAVQAGRLYLGLRQGLPLPGWFFAGVARGEVKRR